MKKNNSSLLMRMAEILCVVLLAAMTLITFANVLSRHIFHSSISASEEITTNLFVLLSLTGAALAARSHQHIGFNLLSDKLSPKGKLIHDIFEGLIGAGFMGFLAYYGALRIVQQINSNQVSAGLNMPMWVYGGLCLLGFLILVAVFLEIAITAIVKLKKHEYEIKGEDK